MRASIQRRLLSTLLIGGSALAIPLSAEAGNKAKSAHAAEKTDVSDAQILGIADTANSGEIEQANIALSKAQKDSVKQFAQLMVKDHTAAKEKGKVVGRELGLTPAPSALANGIEKDGDAVTSQLEKATPSDFDMTYLQLQVREHEKVLKAIDGLIPKADAQQVKGLLTDMRGHVEHHLATARTTLASLAK
jgi:putative membrane protein